MASMVVLVAIDWTSLDWVARVAFGGLIVLGAVMTYRIFRARGEASARVAGWEGRYFDHVAFTYISLWEGFLILPALNLPFPQVSVPAVAVGVFVVAHWLLTRYRHGVIAPVRTSGEASGRVRPEGSAQEMA